MDPTVESEIESLIEIIEANLEADIPKYDHDSEDDAETPPPPPGTPSPIEHVRAQTNKYDEFQKLFPPADASQKLVFLWLSIWFSSRNIHESEYRQLPRKIWWDGQDIRRLKEDEMVHALYWADMELWCKSLARDIVEARKVAAKKEKKVGNGVGGGQNNVGARNRLHFLFVMGHLLLVVLGAWSALKFLSQILFYMIVGDHRGA